MWRTKLRLLTVTLWVGSLWTMAYLVAPVLFSTLPDRVLAGTIAGSLFRLEAWLTVACAAGLTMMQLLWPVTAIARQKKIFMALVWGMLACTLIGYFGLQPMMAALRLEAAGTVMQGAARTQFGILHGAAAGFYLLQSLLGMALVWRCSENKA
jgi:hypothetical protein